MDLANSDAAACSTSERSPTQDVSSTSPKPDAPQHDIPDIQEQLLTEQIEVTESTENQASASPNIGQHSPSEAQGEEDESDTKDEDSSDSETEPDSDAADVNFQPEDDSDSESHDNDSPDEKQKSKPKRKAKASGPVAKTAQDKVRKKQSRLDRAFKNHIRNELARKREFGEMDVDIEPPRAKRPCIRFKKSKTTFAGTNNMEIDERDKPSDLKHRLDNRQITQKERDEDLKGRVSHGTNNRRSGTQKRDLKEATGIFGNNKVKCFANGTYHLKGMRPDNRLKEEQLPAVSWMVQRERGIAPPYGGLLCDDTGLGKTMIAMACIVGNPPTQQDLEDFSGTTLIILPSVDIRDQWRNEFKKHVEDIKDQDILTWHNTQFKKDGGDLTTLTGYKVILTTIAELRQYPPEDELQKLDHEHGRNSKEYREALAEIAGAIFGVKWYRIILDEGHAVKNQNTLSFKSCYGLQKKAFFGLTATPLVNQEREMFPYIKLLGVEGIQTLNDLKNRFFKPHDSQAKLDALIHLITYRRTKKDEFLGRPMMDCLPNFKTQEIWVKLSKQERLIYNAVTEHYALTIPPNKLGECTVNAC